MTSVDNQAPQTVGSLRAAVDSPAARLRARRSWRQRLRLPLMIAGPLLVLLAATYWYLTSGRFVSTEDAYVEAGRVAISNDVSGRVVAIEVHDNQYVKKGQVLFRIDPRPFQIAVDQARANLAAARLDVEALKATYRQKLADTRPPRPMRSPRRSWPPTSTPSPTCWPASAAIRTSRSISTRRSRRRGRRSTAPC